MCQRAQANNLQRSTPTQNCTMDHTNFGVCHLPITKNYQAPGFSRNHLLASFAFALSNTFYASHSHQFGSSPRSFPCPFSRSSSSIALNLPRGIPLALLCNPNFNFILMSCQRPKEPTPQGSQIPQSTAAQHYKTSNLSKEREKRLHKTSPEL